MRRRTRLGLGLFVFFGLCLTGVRCGAPTAPASGETGTLKVLITDKPFPFEFIEEALITITSVEVRRAGGGIASVDAGCVSDADCDDGLPCNGAEACDLATRDCMAGEPLVCGDTEVCDDFRSGCAALCVDDAECADGAMCNGDESCDLATGACVAGTAFECLDGEVCDEATAGCVPDTANDNDSDDDSEDDSDDSDSDDDDDSDDDVAAAGCVADADCDDGLPCNGAEICDLATGDCAVGEPLVCLDTEVCDDFRGGCAAGCVDDAECADGAICNGDESCDLATGDCVAGTAFECLDGEVCDEATAGCVPVPAAADDDDSNDSDDDSDGSDDSDDDSDDDDDTDAAAGCVADADCDDGLPCNGAETCDLATGDCAAGEQLVCADSEVCDDFRGGCVAGCADDAECADGAMCNGDESCDLATGACVAGAAFECLDGEVCDEATAGCVPDTATDDSDDDDSDSDDDDDDSDDGDNIAGSPWVQVFQGEKTFNLIELQGGVTDILADLDVPAGTYMQMRLIVTQGSVKVEGVDAPFVLTVPSGSQTGIKLNFTFSVAPEGHTTLLLDVDLSRAFKPIPGGRIDSPEDIREFKFSPSLAMRLINLQNAGSISGTVTTTVDDLPVAVEAASVTAFFGGEEVTTTSTNENGAYVLSALAAGDYRIEVSASGFDDAEIASVSVEAGQGVMDVDVLLTAESTPTDPGPPAP